MAYQLEKGESFLQGIIRIGIEEQKSAIEALQNGDPHKGVHQARKHLKKLRAIFRFLRDHLGKENFKEANIYYRDIGRDLSLIRDITSQMEISHKLSENYAAKIGIEGFDQLLHILQKERKKIEKKRMNQALFDEEVQLLKKDKTRFNTSKKELISKEKALKGLVRVYKRGFRGFQMAQVFAEVEAMHDWRKQVKYLWHQFQLINQAWPEVFLAYESVLKNLADALGDYHDLALLQEKLHQLKQELPEEFAGHLHKIAEKEKEKNLAHCIELGQLIYTEKPKAFKRRMATMIDRFF